MWCTVFGDTKIYFGIQNFTGGKAVCMECEMLLAVRKFIWGTKMYMGGTAIYMWVWKLMWGHDNLYGTWYFIGGTAICMGVRNFICVTTVYLGYDNVYGCTAIYAGVGNFCGAMIIYKGYDILLEVQQFVWRHETYFSVRQFIRGTKMYMRGAAICKRLWQKKLLVRGGIIIYMGYDILLSVRQFIWWGGGGFTTPYLGYDTSYGDGTLHMICHLLIFQFPPNHFFSACSVCFPPSLVCVFFHVCLP